MHPDVKHARVPGKLLIVGFGSVGQAVLPLLLRHLVLRPGQISIIAASDDGASIAQEFGVAFERQVLTEANYVSVLTARLGAGDFLLNLSVDVSSLALIELCWQCGALYLDASIEPWAGGYTDTARTASQRSNYALREAVLAFARGKQIGPTAIVTQGANPGLASSFVRQALMNMAADCKLTVDKPRNPEAWAALAQGLGIKTIHIAERDSQTTPQRKQRDEFVNTWSVAGFIGEGTQPSELGWGSHERELPKDGARHGFGCDAAIYLNRPGMATRVRSWTPLEGAFHGFLVTHGESISIADHLTLRRNGQAVYRPTVHYAYHPCDDAVLSVHELAGKNWQPQSGQRILRDDIVRGIDELGVLLMGSALGVYWFGSRLSIDEARKLAPYNSATSLQVAAGVLAGMVWALRQPQAGLVEPDDIDHEAVLAIAKPYLGELVGVYGNWSPLQNRGPLFAEELALDDPWQFKNFRVA
ncbi:saccharopine dehydrogenase C-terminal domain-containing protein [Rhodoferax sp.]|uniref:homospermidine synthase n=1 Tax=Rhodoferax sp. TaxID=50421 RepID=UPI001A0A776C|nr:saccharopine dehydrogenase C-terminal domain-containing protein [Rhodoferax sp.]MBE0474585.1 homospermidine synthase [Rhodoferax sp.]